MDREQSSTEGTKQNYFGIGIARWSFIIIIVALYVLSQMGYYNSNGSPGSMTALGQVVIGVVLFGFILRYIGLVKKNNSTQVPVPVPTTLTTQAKGDWLFSISKILTKFLGVLSIFSLAVMPIMLFGLALSDGSVNLQSPLAAYMLISAGPVGLPGIFLVKWSSRLNGYEKKAFDNVLIANLVAVIISGFMFYFIGWPGVDIFTLCSLVFVLWLVQFNKFKN